MILAGDIGGTNTRLALFAVEAGDRLVAVAERRFASRDHGGLSSLVHAFTAAEGAAAGRRIEAAGFGIAGPVVSGRVATTNLPWVVDGRDLASLGAFRGGPVAAAPRS